MSLINDALKRASEAQGQAAQRPRGPKGVEDLPVPMTPVATRERPAWLPIAGISVLVVALLGASGFFFSKWWKERQAWQPYVETPEDDDGTNAMAKAKSPPVQVAKKTDSVTPPSKPTATNPPSKVATSPIPAPANPPAPVAVTPKPPPVPAATNPVVAAAPAMTNPPPVVVVPVPAPPPAATNPPPVTPPAVAMAPTNPPPVVIPPAKTPGDTAKKTDDPVTKVASVEFPEIKLQGIIRAKKKVSAVVNGKTLSLGDRIEGAFLLKIDTESVTFEKGSVKREFFLLR